MVNYNDRTYKRGLLMVKRLVLSAVVFLLAGLVLAAWADRPASAGKSSPDGKVQFARDIRPILATNCFTCHGPDQGPRKAGLRLDLPDEARQELRSGNRAIVPGKVQESQLVARIFATDKKVMPPPDSNHKLKESEKELLKLWIEQGAEYQPHWAFVAPKRPALPTVQNTEWPRNPIDRLVLARLEAEGLKPTPEADRYTLARRVALDLTGLPPTLEMADRFVNDPSPDAYEKYVDLVLKLPAYGERWAQVWLDQARYADTNGYAHDGVRSIWPYRDWVIDAINANIPLDQFTVEQIAGDLLTNPKPSQLVATGFHRNTLMNDEGGSSDEEFRVVAVVDRVNTTMQVWMGLTMACAQCHDHKYDPISQEDYYRMYAIFNQTEDNNKKDNKPTLNLPTSDQQDQKRKLEADIGLLQEKLDELTPDLLKPARDKIDGLKKQLAAIKPVSTMIMKELSEENQRVTKIHIRGDFLNQGRVVQPGLPAAFPPLPAGEKMDRLGLARWLVDQCNPLTARVAVNRYWEQIFAAGLVQTPEDFGIRSNLPIHPELLDWLATEFMSPTPSEARGPDEQIKGWDVKQLLRMYLTSATYRQSTKLTPELGERDPDNRLFARGPRQRATAEMIRDQALFVSGLLNPKMHGPPVRPPQPALNLKAAFNANIEWVASKGQDRLRRALYTQWRRYTPYPSMSTFDAPDRNVCTVSRPRTNTPLQALVTLNDPCFVETAQGLARRMVKEGGSTVASRVTYGFRLCLIRPPLEAESARLVALLAQAKGDYAKKPAEALQIATDPLGPLPADMDPVELAAYTVVANVLLNLDETLAKR
jgi:mono/diheme cytochrome c family protein